MIRQRILPSVFFITLSVFTECAVFSQSKPPLKNNSVWQMDRIKTAKGKILNGLLEKSAKIKNGEGEDFFIELKRQKGTSMYLIVHRLSPGSYKILKKLDRQQRDVLSRRIHQFRNRVQIQTTKMQDIHLKSVMVKNQRHFQYQSKRFDLESTSDETTTRRCVVRVQQLLLAYSSLFPARIQPPKKKLIILMLGSEREYTAYLKTQRLDIRNPAFYSGKNNQIVAGSNLTLCGKQLAKIQKQIEHHQAEYEKVYASYQSRIKQLKSELESTGVKKAEIKEYLKLIRRSLKKHQDEMKAQIILSKRYNNNIFNKMNKKMLARLNHEVLHAYLTNYIDRPDHDLKNNQQQQRIPRWLNEGLAQIFESARFDAGTLRIDAPDERRLRDLKRELSAGQHLPISKFLQTDRPYFLTSHAGEKGDARRMYLYSWAVTYYLVFGDKPLNYKDLQTLATNNWTPQQQLKYLSGTDLATFEKQWHRYMLRLTAKGNSR